MITSFLDKGLAQFFQTGSTAKLSVQNSARVSRMLQVLAAATVPEDANLPGYRFHELQGDRAGTYSITVTGNWRITFKFEEGDAYDVDLEDYH